MIKIYISSVLSIAFFSYSCKSQKITNSLFTDSSKVQGIDLSKEINFHFLKDILKDKRIVLLGEKTHSDGTTLELKVDLIKYLHDSLGYNYLLTEHGIYGTDRAWRDIVEKKDSAVGVFAYLFNLFGDILQEHNIKFAHYVEDQIKSQKPLYIKGIDILGDDTYEHALEIELEQLLKKLAPANNSSILEDFEKFSLRKSRRYFLSSGESLKWLRSINLDSVSYFGNRVIDFLKKEQGKNMPDTGLTKRIPLFLQSIKSVIRSYPYIISITEEMLSREYNGIQKTQDRDEYMFENACWYIDSLPNEKFIISLATKHTSKDFSYLRDAHSDFKGVKPVGEFLAEKYKNDVYSACFVNYEGERMHRYSYEVTKTPVAPPGSIEALLHNQKYKLFFLKLSDTPKAISRMMLSPVYDKWYLADWSKIYDGIFFIDVMKASKIRLLKQRVGKKQPYDFK